MADEAENAAEDAEAGEEAAPEKKSGPLPYVIVGILGTAFGLAVPFLIPTGDVPAEEPAEVLPKKEYEGTDVEKTLVDFDEDAVVLNLNDEQATRYLSLEMSLVISQESLATFTEKLEKKRVEMKNWLIGHVADKTLKDIEGKAGRNRLRREILDQFNAIMFPDGEDRIFDIYYKGFAIQ